MIGRQRKVEILITAILKSGTNSERNFKSKKPPNREHHNVLEAVPQKGKIVFHSHHQRGRKRRKKPNKKV
jgi:hypothetical protein